MNAGRSSLNSNSLEEHMSKPRNESARPERARPIDRQTAHEIQAFNDGTNDLLVSDVIRTNEKQVWFVSGHLVDVPLVKAD